MVGTSVVRAPRRLSSVQGNERACALLGAMTIACSSILVRLSHASPSTAAIFRCVYELPALGWLATGAGVLAVPERSEFG